MKRTHLIKIVILVSALVCARAWGDFSIADTLVFGWLLLIVLWQKEGGMTMVAGVGILGLRSILKLARPDLIVDHLAHYALWMIGTGFVIWIFERYDVISQEFWERVVEAAQSKQIKHAMGVQGRSLIKGFWRFLLRSREVFLSIPFIVRIKIFIVLACFLLLLAGTQIQVLDVLVLIFLFSGVLFSWDPRISFGLALAGLVMTPWFLIIGKNIIAEVVVIHAYYFLLIGVLEEIVQMIRSNKGKDKGIAVDKV